MTKQAKQRVKEAIKAQREIARANPPGFKLGTIRFIKSNSKLPEKEIHSSNNAMRLWVELGYAPKALAGETIRSINIIDNETLFKILHPKTEYLVSHDPKTNRFNIAKGTGAKAQFEKYTNILSFNVDELKKMIAKNT